MITSGVGSGLSLLPFGPVAGTPSPGVFIVDNVIYNFSPDLPGRNVDFYGLVFGNTTTDQINIWGNGPGNGPSSSPGHDTLYRWTPSTGYSPTFTGGTFTLTPVPEPSSFALLGLGGVGLAIGAIRRRQTAV